MLTGMEVQRESGQSKDENVVRLKKKINALIDLLEKTQKEKHFQAGMYFLFSLSQ